LETFYEFITNKETNTNKIDIFGEISWWDDNDAKAFKNKLKEVGKSDVEVVINSPGGYVYDGVTINNLLKEHPGKVTTKVAGFAGSAASVIFVAGDEREMPSNTNLMIHAPIMPSLFEKNAKELREIADNLDVVQESSANSYRDVMKNPDDIDGLMKKTTYFTADQALEDGFATKVTGKTKIKNCFDFKELGYDISKMPKNILSKFDKNHKPIVTKIKGLFTNKYEETVDMDELKELKATVDSMSKVVDNLKQSQTDSVIKLEGMTKTVDSQKAIIDLQVNEIVNLKKTNKESSVENRKKQYAQFLTSIVNRVPPVEHASQIKIMEMMYEADSKIEPLTDENSELVGYKNMLSKRNIIVDIGNVDFANSNTAVELDTLDEEKLDKEVRAELAKQISNGIATCYGDVAIELMEKKKEAL
jgi:ATP-dependent Clp protease protease subunit